jgi:hypothetical protein
MIFETGSKKLFPGFGFAELETKAKIVTLLFL